MRKRMDIMYLNPNMEGVRQIALRNFKEIYTEILNDLKTLPDYDYYHKKTPLIDLIKKYEELIK